MRPGPLILSVLLLSPVAASAEAVRLQVAGRSTVVGQGWLFRDPRSGFCGVVTAAHVAAPGGSPSSVTIVARDGTEGMGRNVTVLSPAPAGGDPARSALDVAVMAVEGTILRRGCTTATLGTPGVRFLLSKSRDGVLTEVVETDATMQDVQILAAAQEDDRLLSLRPARAGDEIQQGVSGSVVTEREDRRVSEGLRPLPLAMVTSVEGGVARAVRFDAVKGLAERAIATWPAARIASGPTVLAWDGATTDPSCPAPNALTAAGCGWLVGARSGRRTVSLEIAPGDVEISRVRVRATGAASGERVIVETSAASTGDAWSFARAGRLADGVAQVRLATSRVARVRVTLATVPDERLEIRVDLDRGGG